MPSRSSSSMMEPSPLLQGPRPAPLKVSTTTGTEMAVKKRRQPVIIYVESPRVVHAHPAEFKSVVQRLTGAPAPAPTPPPLQFPFPFQFQFPSLAVGAAGSATSALLPPLTSSISMSSVTVADASGSSSSVQGNLSSDPFLPPLPPPSLGAFYHHQQQHGGDLFIAHHQ